MSAITAVSINGEKIKLAEKAVNEFRGNLGGSLIGAGDSRYDEARAVWNGMIDRKPSLIAECTSSDDVMAAVKFARRYNLKFSIRSGGHHVTGKAICDDGLVIDLSRMNKVTVNPDKSTAIVQGGATLGDVDAETTKYGLAAPLGVVSATGVAGLTLHGGYGWHARKHGLSLDNILSVEIVLADGKMVKASEKENPDLFWAIRGGGGNFGVITSFEFQLHPIESKVWLLLTLYPVHKAKEGLELFRNYIPNAPDELMAIVVLWNAPNEEFIPEDYRGKPVFILAGSYSGPLEAGEKAIAPFRQLGDHVADLSAPMPFSEMQKFLDADYPDGRNYYWKSAYINELSDETIDMLIERAADRPSPLSSIDVWALGGKLNRIDPGSTAFYQREAPYLIGIESNWDDPKDSEKNVSWTRNFYNKLVEKTDIGLYMNFPGFAEEGDDLMKKTYGPNYNRLREIKAKYDPDNFFQGFLSLNGHNGNK